MKHSLIVLSLLFTTVQAAWAVDAVQYLDEKKPQARGTITAMTKDLVTVQDPTTNEVTKIPTPAVKLIIWDKEPQPLKTARQAMRNDNDASKCQTELAKLDANEKLRDEVKMEVQYYRALSKSRLAIAGREKVTAAGSEMLAVLKAYPDNYHFYEATETVGHLLRANGDHAKALEKFASLAGNPTYKLKAMLGTGWTQLDQQQPADAQKTFEQVISAAGSSADNKEIRDMATLGKAAALGLQDKTDEAAKLVQGVIAKADPEERTTHARAYNVLGSIYKKAIAADKANAKQAVMAYLHIDLLYPQDAAEHAEALGNLATLWREVGHPQRAADASARLKREYPVSRWLASSGG